MKIAISNGHGYDTAGKRTPAFPDTGKVIREWEFNHPTARHLKEILERSGHQILMVSDTIVDTPLRERIKKANDWGADLYISIHYNAYQGKWGTHGGVETLYLDTSEKSKSLALKVQKELAVATQWRDRGIKSRPSTGSLRLAELADTKMPAIICECGFMDNLEEASKMLDVSYQILCATAIAAGVNEYLGVKTPPQPKADQGHIKLRLMGKPLSVRGFISEGVSYMDLNGVLIPIRLLFETIGCTVSWDKETNAIEITRRL